MQQSSRYSDLRLIWRSLALTDTEFIGCLLAGCCIFLAHLLSVSLNLGQFMTKFFDSQLVVLYTNDVISPIQQVFHNTAISTAIVIIMWGIAGLIFYSLIAFILGLYGDWHNTEHEIIMARPGDVTTHPLRKMFLVRTAWRFSISTLTFLFTITLLPLIRDRLLNDNLLFGVKSLTSDALNIGYSIVIWAIIFHCYIVLLRLYLFRTRVFGEIIY